MTSMNVDTSMTNEQILSNAASLQAQAAIGIIPEQESKIIDYESSTDGQASCSKSNEQVLVHPPPNGMCTDDDVLMIDEDGAVSMSSPKNVVREPISNVNTGLSQSDLSVSSSGGSNRAYSYGTQEPYSIDTQNYQSQHIHAAEVIDRMESPDPVTIINELEHVNQILDAIAPVSNANDNNQIEALPMENTNEILVPSTAFNAGDAIITSTLNHTIQIDVNDIYTAKVQQNGIKTFDLSKADVNGKVNGEHTNGLNGNSHLIEESNDFDSLMNLPAPPPPSCDEKLHDVNALENNNLDALPPPPPELVPAVGSINVES